MRPRKKQYTLQMPLTFENSDRFKPIGKDQFFLSGLILVVWLALSIIILIKGSGIQRVTYPIYLFIAVITVIRVFIIREKYYLKKKQELESKEYLYDNNLFWDIYEISEAYPYICRYTGGMKSIFVVFEKDVIIGRREDNDYYHAEAIADAYLQMVKRNITCMHIDYMDSVGKDARMEGLFESAARTENEDLRGLLTVIYDNVQQQMHKTYDSYDVYCFYYTGADSLFWEECRDILEYFLRANYLNARILNAHGIGDLSKTLANLNNFSVNNATSRLFVGGNTEYITPIWVKNGVEKTVLNQTIEERKEAFRIERAEKEARGAKKKFRRSKRGKILEKVREQEEIDLFEDIRDDTDYGYDLYKEVEPNIEITKKEKTSESSVNKIKDDIIEDEEKNLWDL